jgi:hypothetical protein
VSAHRRATEPNLNWTIAVTGGSPSVNAVLVPADSFDSASFSVTMFGHTATVEMTVALPNGWEIYGSCFDFDAQAQIEALVPPRRLVLEVVAGHHYRCTYGSRIADPPGAPPTAAVILYVPAHEFDVSRPWPISVTGGRAALFAVGRPGISAVRLTRCPAASLSRSSEGRRRSS